MSKVKIQGNASGTGVVTLTAPNTNIDRTITLPDGDISLGVGIDDNATSTAITIDSSESVNIPNTLKLGADNTLTSLFTIQDTSGNNGMRIINQNTGEGYIIFGNQVDNNVGSVGYDHPNQAMTFDVNNAERMRITSTGDVEVETGNLVIGTSGKGIDFSADANNANMTSEVLDDYEEGTWTPNLNVEVGTNPTYTVTEARYTKIGRVVHAYAKLNITAVGTGHLRCSFPFTPPSSQLRYGGARFKDNTGNYRHVSVSGYNISYMNFTYEDNSTYYVNAAYLSTGTIGLNITYTV